MVAILKINLRHCGLINGVISSVYTCICSFLFPDPSSRTNCLLYRIELNNIGGPPDCLKCETGYHVSAGYVCSRKMEYKKLVLSYSAISGTLSITLKLFIIAISIPVLFCHIFAGDGLCAECDTGYYRDELSAHCARKTNQMKRTVSL